VVCSDVGFSPLFLLNLLPGRNRITAAANSVRRGTKGSRMSPFHPNVSPLGATVSGSWGHHAKSAELMPAVCFGVRKRAFARGTQRQIWTSMILSGALAVWFSAFRPPAASRGGQPAGRRLSRLILRSVQRCEPCDGLSSTEHHRCHRNADCGDGGERDPNLTNLALVAHSLCLELNRNGGQFV
jgi:hypothetical protein